MLGERLDAVAIGPTDPRLRACRAELIAGTLRVTLPDGEAVAGDAVERALSALLERRVRLETTGTPAADARPGRPPRDPAVLHVIVARHRVDLGPVGRQGCAGSCAEVARAGALRVGERLVPERALRGEPGRGRPRDARAPVPQAPPGSTDCQVVR